MNQIINPTKENPLVLVKRKTPLYITLIKHWVSTNVPHAIQDLHTSTCKIQLTDNVSLGWSKPERTSHKGITMIACYYSPSDHTFSTKILQSPNLANFCAKTQAIIDANYSFANSPDTILTNEQARILYFVLDRQHLDPNEASSNVAMQQFLSRWPGIQKNNYQGPGQEDNFLPHPNSNEQAIAAYAAHLNKETFAAASPTLTNSGPPTPILCPTQPTEQQPLTAYITKPINHGNFTISKSQPSGQYEIYVVNSPATFTKQSRQVIYAKPILHSDRNPTKLPFPLCSPKSTTATLHWDANPNSATYQEPIVLSSIQTALTSIFMPKHPHTHKTCEHCGADFKPERSTSRFCSIPCRTTFYSQARRKNPQTAPAQAPAQAPSPPSTQTPQDPTAQSVTREEFKELSSQVQMIIDLLKSRPL